MAAKVEKYDASSISILEGLEAVRKRPGMYIGSTSTKGLNHLIYEITDNSVDEHLAGHCTAISVTINADGTATITDNGRGIPVGIHPKAGIPAVEVVFTILHAGGKFGDGGYKISGGLHGVGASVVNALSDWLEVKIRRDGIVYEQRYERGKACYSLRECGTCRKNDTGTSVTFMPDATIFDTIKFDSQRIKNRLHETAYLNPGLALNFEDKRKGSEEKVQFHEPEGIVAYVKALNKDKNVIHDVGYYKDTKEGIEVEVAFQYVDEFQEEILGFCNNIYTAEGGTHLTGFKAKFTMVINQYARELGILKEKDPNFTGGDVRNGMTAVVAIKHPEPRFEGQTKTKLDNPDAGKVVGDITGDELVRYFDRNLETLKNVIACAEKSAKIRKQEEKAKTNLLVKQKFSCDISSLTVAMDLSNGMANLFAKEIFGTGENIHYLFDTMDGRFPNHEPNPLIEKNVIPLENLVREVKADAGVIYDGDADRVMFVDEAGRFISPDLMIALMGRYFVEERGLKGLVLQDIRSSKAVGEYLAPMGCEMRTWKVGRAFAAAKLREIDGVWGGELAGHYYFRDFFYSDSGLLASMIILRIVAKLKKEGKTLSQAIAEIVRYQNSGEINYRIEDKKGAMDAVKEHFMSKEEATAFMDFDGYRVEFPTWWFNIRPSNTEPYLRFLCEATSEELLKEKIAEVDNLLKTRFGASR